MSHIYLHLLQSNEPVIVTMEICPKCISSKWQEIRKWRIIAFEINKMSHFSVSVILIVYLLLFSWFNLSLSLYLALSLSYSHTLTHIRTHIHTHTHTHWFLRFSNRYFGIVQGTVVELIFCSWLQIWAGGLIKLFFKKCVCENERESVCERVKK